MIYASLPLWAIMALMLYCAGGFLHASWNNDDGAETFVGLVLSTTCLLLSAFAGIAATYVWRLA